MPTPGDPPPGNSSERFIGPELQITTESGKIAHQFSDYMTMVDNCSREEAQLDRFPSSKVEVSHPIASPLFSSVGMSLNVDSYMRRIQKNEAFDTIQPMADKPDETPSLKPFEITGNVSFYLKDIGAGGDHSFFSSTRRQTICEKLKLINGIEARLEENGTIIITKNGRMYNLDLGELDLDHAIKAVQEKNQRYGWSDPEPTHNDRIRLSLSQSMQLGASIVSEIETICQDIAVIGSAVGSESERVFGYMPTKYEAELLSHSTQRKETQMARGYAISDYEAGHYDINGIPLAEAILSDLDRVEFQRWESIFENRLLGDGQVLTIAPQAHELVFGRWGGKEASTQGRQADILISHDIRPTDHLYRNEYGVSRRHFSLIQDSQIDEYVTKVTDGKHKTGLFLTDLNSSLGTSILRSDENMAFIPTEDNEEKFGWYRRKGDSAILFPGDIILTGEDSGHEQTHEDHWSRFILIKYLGKDENGQHRFVKTTIDKENASTGDFLKELYALWKPETIEGFVRAVDEHPEFTENVPITQPEPSLDASKLLDDEMIYGAKSYQLLELLRKPAASEALMIRNKNILQILKKTDDPYVLSSALQCAIDELDVENMPELEPIITSSAFWSKLEGQAAVLLLDKLLRSKMIKRDVLYSAQSALWMSQGDKLPPDVKTHLRRIHDEMSEKKI